MITQKEQEDQDKKYNPAEQRHSSEGGHDNLGVHPERREAEVDDLENLYNAESRLGKDRNTELSKNAQDEQAALYDDTSSNRDFATDDENDGFYKPEETGRRFAGVNLNKKNSIIGIMIGSIITLTGITGFVQTTTLIPNHLRELLLGKISSLQIDHSMRYRRSKLHRIQDIFSPDGRKTKKITEEMSKKGYVFLWDKKSGKLLGITPPGASASLMGDELIAQHISDYMEVSHPLRTSRWKTKNTNALLRRGKISPTSIVAKSTEDIEDPDKKVNKEIANEVIDNEPKVTAKVTSDSGGESNEESAQKKQENKVLTEGDDSLDDLEREIRTGEPIENMNKENRNILKLTSESMDNEALETVENIAKKGSLGSKTLSTIKGLSVSDVLDKVCTVKNRLAASVLAARIFRARSLMKYAAIFVKASDSTRVGDVDPKLMNSLMKRVTANDANGNPIGASPGFAYAMKNKFSKSRNSNFKGSFGVDGKLYGTAAAIQNATNVVPGMSENQCGVYQNPAFQVGAAAVEVAIGFFTGGSSEAAVQASQQTAKTLFKEALEKIISKQALKSLIKTVAVEISFEGIMTLTQLYVDRTLSVTFTGQEKGGELGDILVAGGGTMNKQRSLSAGMVPATSSQYAQAQSEYYARKKEENRKKSFYARTFDYDNPDSLVFNLATNVAFMPRTPSAITEKTKGTMSNIASSLFKTPQFAIASMSSSLIGTTYAQATDEISTESVDINGTSYASDPAGNLLPILRTDIESIDPTENIKYLASTGDIDSDTLEPKSENFIQHIDNCVNNIDSITTIEKKDQNDPKFDCTASQPITVKYKAHLAYLDMVDGVNAVFNLDDDSSGGSADATNVNVAEPNYAKNPNIKTDDAPPGAHKKSNCTGGFTTGADSLQKVILEKWKPPVTSVGGYSCRQNTAAPSTSIHGLGRALDVMINGTNPEGLAKGNEIRNWVINNATQLGIQRVIWNRHIWTANKDGWRDYTGPNPHTDHLHIEINLEASTKSNLGR